MEKEIISECAKRMLAVIFSNFVTVLQQLPC